MSNDLATLETLANRFMQVAQEAQANSHKLLKFTKGKYFIGDDDVTDSACVAFIDQMAQGWVKFGDGKVVEQRIGKVADGFVVPKRQELDDLVRRCGKATLLQASHAIPGVFNTLCR